MRAHDAGIVLRHLFFLGQQGDRNALDRHGQARRVYAPIPLPRKYPPPLPLGGPPPW